MNVIAGNAMLVFQEPCIGQLTHFVSAIEKRKGVDRSTLQQDAPSLPGRVIHSIHPSPETAGQMKKTDKKQEIN